MYIQFFFYFLPGVQAAAGLDVGSDVCYLLSAICYLLSQNCHFSPVHKLRQKNKRHGKPGVNKSLPTDGRAAQLYEVLPSIFGPSVWNLVHVTFPAPSILGRLQDLKKIVPSCSKLQAAIAHNYVAFCFLNELKL
jgi:hypothetical protein